MKKRVSWGGVGGRRCNRGVNDVLGALNPKKMHVPEIGYAETRLRFQIKWEQTSALRSRGGTI